MSTLDGIKKWGALGSLSVLDQFFFSGANFFASLLLARMLTVYEYGAYAFVISIFMLQFSLHNALIQEPISVLGFKFLNSDRKKYLKTLFGFHLIVCGFLSLIMLSYWLIAKPSCLSQTIAAYALINPLVFGFIMMRRISYSMLKPSTALFGSIIYFIALIGGLLLIRHKIKLTPTLAFILMGIAGTLAMVIILLMTNHANNPDKEDTQIRLHDIIKEHWAYGKWLLANSALGWSSYYLYMPFLAIVIGLEVAGIYRAMENFIIPLEQSITALGLLITPYVSERRLALKDDINKVLFRLTSVTAIICLIYISVIYLSSDWLCLFYKKDLYGQYTWMIPLFGISALCRAIGDLGVGTMIRASRESKIFFKASLITALVSWSIGLGLVTSYGISGAIWARIMASAICCFSLYYYLNKSINTIRRQ